MSATGIRLTSGTATLNNCQASTLYLYVSQNSGGRVTLAVQDALTTFCIVPLTVTALTPWRFSISGTGTTSGFNTFWNAPLSNVSFDTFGGNYTGSVGAAIAYQPTTAGAPVSINLNGGGTITGPLTSGGHLDGGYTLVGGAGAWSLGN